MPEVKALIVSDGLSGRSRPLRNFEKERTGHRTRSLRLMLTLAGAVSLRWNQMYPSLLVTHRKLRELGLDPGDERC